jgi:hypothetical protein
MDLKETGCERVDCQKIGPSEGSCEHSSDSSDCMKFGEYHDKLSDYHRLKRTAPFYGKKVLYRVHKSLPLDPIQIQMC